MPRREGEHGARDLKTIYTAIDADADHQQLERFDEKWGARFPVITEAWLDDWEHVIPLARVSARGPPRDLHHG
jgi:putative transposase